MIRLFVCVSIFLGLLFVESSQQALRKPSKQVRYKYLGPISARKHFKHLVKSVARQHKIDSALLESVIEMESRWNPNVKSSAGAVGLMQLMPSTCKRYGVEDPLDPRQNIVGGTKYLKYLLELFDNNIELALAAYNAGHAKVLQAGRKIPQIRQTRSYVKSVLEQYDHYLTFD